MTARIRTFVATNDDGSQTMIELYPDGHVNVAFRAQRSDCWSAPVTATDMTWPS